MRQVILDFPKQFEVGLKAAENIKIEGDFDNVVICGVGGSALPGNLLLNITNLAFPVFIHRDYGLPKIADATSLIVCISFSGNTEETLSAYQEAVEKNFKPVAICTGGKLQELAKQNNLPVAIVPNDCLQPRFGTGYLVAALIKILENCSLITGVSQEILKTAESLNPETFEAQGKSLAEKLVNKIPIIYTSSRYKTLARIWKIKFNENSKVMAFWNYFPELNHNEMVGFSKVQNSKCKIQSYFVIILRDSQDNPKILKRMELTADLIKEAGAGVEIIEMQGNNKIEKIFNSLLLGDWVSYYLALSYDQNPVPVAIVESFKKQL